MMVTPPAAARRLAARALPHLPPRLAGRLADRPSSRRPIERALAAARPDLDDAARRALAGAAAVEAAEARAQQRRLQAATGDSMRAARRLCARVSLDGWRHLDPPQATVAGRVFVLAPTVWWPSALVALDVWHGPVDLLVPRWTLQPTDALTAASPATAPPRGDLLQSVDIEFLADRLRAGGRVAALPPPAATPRGYDPAPLEPLREAAASCDVPVLTVTAVRDARRRLRLRLTVASPDPSSGRSSTDRSSTDRAFAEVLQSTPAAWAWSSAV